VPRLLASRGPAAPSLTCRPRAPDYGGKQIELLGEIVTRLHRIGFIPNAGSPGALGEMRAFSMSTPTRFTTLALAARTPTTYGSRELAEIGDLMPFARNLPELYRRAAELVDKILRGATPATFRSNSLLTLNSLSI
jgi:hypothetical protein